MVDGWNKNPNQLSALYSDTSKFLSRNLNIYFESADVIASGISLKISILGRKLNSIRCLSGGEVRLVGDYFWYHECEWNS